MKVTPWILALLIFGFLVVIGLVALVMLTGHDALSFVYDIGSLLTAIAAFTALFNNQRKQSEDIRTVKSNTNGTLSALLAKVESLTQKLNIALAKLPPEDATEVIEHTVSKADMPR